MEAVINSLGARLGTAWVFLFMSGCGGGSSTPSLHSSVSSAAVTVLYSFGATSTDGATPLGLILGTDDNFYGTTHSGGSYSAYYIGEPLTAPPIGAGTVFKITPAGVETVLYSFGASSTDGAGPSTGVIQGTDGNFYGTTTRGGAMGGGTVFKITAAGSETVLHSFSTSSTNGSIFPSRLIQGTDGNFYGTTAGGGSNGNGTVFKITN